MPSRQSSKVKKDVSEERKEEEDSDASDQESLQLGDDDGDDDDDDDDDDECDDDEIRVKNPTIKEQLQDLSDEEKSNEDEDDAAPNDVSFATSKQSALERLQKARAQIEKEKAGVKEKRKKRDLLYQQQKKQKLVSSVQPDSSPSGVHDEHSTVDVVEEDKTRLDGKNLAQTSKTNEHVQFTDDDDNENDDENENNLISKEDVEDYIPLIRAGGLKPVRIRDVARLMPDKHSAAMFRREQLFGSRIKRETMGQRLAAKEKKKARHRSTSAVH